MILHIKNMVCDRCIMLVRQQLQQAGLTVSEINLGTATVSPEPDSEQLALIASQFKISGFELLDNEKDRIIERIKNLIVEKVHHSDMSDLQLNFSKYLSTGLTKEYAYLSRMFSDAEDITIEKFIIQQKIEKVKELLEYGELNLNEITWKMGYSSSAHLSAQFKLVTGLTPSQFRASQQGGRKPLDKLTAP